MTSRLFGLLAATILPVAVAHAGPPEAPSYDGSEHEEWTPENGRVPRSESDVGAKAVCDVQSRFRAAVVSALGETRATQQAGFALRIIERATGRLLCSGNVSEARSIYPASAIKTLIAAAVLRKVDAGQITLDTLVTIQQRNATEETRYWGPGYANGKRLTVRKLMTDMLVVSNNTATNQLIDVATKPYINETARLVGGPSLVVNRKVYSGSVPAEDPLPPQRNAATAAGFTPLYKEIATGTRAVLSPASRATLADILGRVAHNDRLNKNFPAGVKFFHKPGNTSQVASDAGYFYFGPSQKYLAIVAGLQEFPSYSTLQAAGEKIYRVVIETEIR